MRSQWDGHLVVKGILSPEDAEIATQHAIDGIIVSNHGGRQLDGTSSTIAALPKIVEEVAGALEVCADGGVRSGSDVPKMVDAGAKCVLIGRAFLYGLGAMGGEGVRRALEIIHNELDVSMALSGRVKLENFK